MPRYMNMVVDKATCWNKNRVCMNMFIVLCFLPRIRIPANKLSGELSESIPPLMAKRVIFLAWEIKKLQADVEVGTGGIK